MLSKLLKYEFKATCRIYGGLYLAILAAAALLGAFFRFPALASDFPIAVVTIVYLMLCVAIAVITALTIIQRFTRNLLGREGYLMHTLPVTPAQLILSKLISSVVWLPCSILVTALSSVYSSCAMLNVNGIFLDWAGAVRDFRCWLADILQRPECQRIHALLTAIEWLATLVCSILRLVHTARMIGHQFCSIFCAGGHRGLCGSERCAEPPYGPAAQHHRAGIFGLAAPTPPTPPGWIWSSLSGDTWQVTTNRFYLRAVLVSPPGRCGAVRCSLAATNWLMKNKTGSD